MPRIRTSSGNISANTWSRVWGGGIAGATGDDQSSIELKIQNRGASDATVYVAVRDSAGDPPSTSDESVLYSESVAPDGILQIRDDIASLYSVHVRATQDVTYQISGAVDDIAPPSWLQDIIDVAGAPSAAFDFAEQDYRLTNDYVRYDFDEVPGGVFGANAPNLTLEGLLVEDSLDSVTLTDLDALGLAGMAANGCSMLADVTLADNQPSAFPWVFGLSDGMSADRHGTFWHRATERWTSIARISRTSTSVIDSINSPDDTRYKVAASFDPAGVYRISVSGRVVSNNNAVDLSVQDRIEIMFGDNLMVGSLKRLVIFPRALTNAELQALTA